ncbi:type II toxin-antitoxin system HipA family toxin [Alteromonas aestuariivivens]|uniref:Type II toxin-antitoxin system HipA family toxin n=1 Tax=Alteromonas aestuariivivens TaxID=1938339 RepID=A0A3D8M6M1_9ALTE|nr:type II toxin-antitoxin system HipA family toxin [Alteromonas aestuariivivens]RDV25426.1 type II toxin-antitoxin system HipA family toxin [Alteromonas aestuariivivens]
MATLQLYLNQAHIGELIMRNDGAHQLHYASSWLTHPKARPLSLSLPLQKGRITSEQVYNYFDNLLPDSQRIRERIVKRFNAASSRPFDLLAQVGRDSVGALTILQDSYPQQSPSLDYEQLRDKRLKALLLAYQSDMPLGMAEEEELRISVAGAQEKTALLNINGQWCVPKGLTPTTHIIKLPIGQIKGPDFTLDLSDSVENEWLCIELARELGFAVPAVDIVRVDEVKALAVERFDRRWTADKNNILRLPQEDMCQAHGLPPAIKYEAEGGPGIEQIMKLLMGSSNALADRDAFMRFQVFQWLIGATDGHAKNFSIYLEAGGAYRLTPFYDILSAYPITGGQGLHLRDLSLAMGLTATKGKKRKIDQIFPRHFVATAKSVGFDPARMQSIMLKFVDELPVAIEKLKRRMHAEIPDSIQTAIFEQSLMKLERLKSAPM